MDGARGGPARGDEWHDPAKAGSSVTLRSIARSARRPGAALTVGVALSSIAAGVGMAPAAEANSPMRASQGPTASFTATEPLLEQRLHRDTTTDQEEVHELQPA